MYQPIQFKNTTILLALAILTILCANISFAQVDYSTLNYPGGAMGSSTFLTGIRGAGGENVYIFLPGSPRWQRRLDPPELSEFPRRHRYEHDALRAGRPVFQ